MRLQGPRDPGLSGSLTGRLIVADGFARSLDGAEQGFDMGGKVGEHLAEGTAEAGPGHEAIQPPHLGVDAQDAQIAIQGAESHRGAIVIGFDGSG